MDSPRPTEDALTFLFTVAATPTIVSVQVGGEVDASNIGQLDAALAAVALNGADSVHLELRRLTFCDCAAAGLLLEFTRKADRAGKQTTIHGARPIIQKVLTLLADADQPTFE